MNLETLQAMPDAELNELSARKVMEWEKVWNRMSDRYVYGIRGSWNPTTDMNDAMQLLIKFKNVRMTMNHSGGWIVSIGDFDEYQPTLPRAITIASILAKEGEQ